MMKKVTFFILALIATVSADDDAILKELSKQLKTDVTIINECLDNNEIKSEELYTWLQMWEVQKDSKDGDFNEEQAFVKFSSFLACLLEKQGMMVDTILIPDKIYESLEKDKDMIQPPQKEIYMECVTSINEKQMTREERAFSLILCVEKAIGGEERK